MGNYKNQHVIRNSEAKTKNMVLCERHLGKGLRDLGKGKRGLVKGKRLWKRKETLEKER